MGVLFWVGIVLIIAAAVTLISRRLKWELPAALALIGVLLTAAQIVQGAAFNEKPSALGTSSAASSGLSSSSPPAFSPSASSTPASAASYEIRATRASYAGLCMAADGNTVVTAVCTGAESQQWTTDDSGHIVSSNGQCMDPAGAGGGQSLLVTSCTASAMQEWHFVGGRIMSGELCLTIRGPSTTPGTTIQTWNTQEDSTLADEMYWEPT